MRSHHDPEADPDVDAAVADLWFVTAVSNPVRYKTRYALFRKFKHHILHDLGANLVTVECALGERGFQVTGGDPCEGGPRHIEVQVRNKTQLWTKENLLNIGATRLPLTAKYIVFCDADVRFCNPHILTETIHALQIHKVVQPFETCCDMGPNGQVMQVHRSFGFCHANNWEWKPVSAKAGYGANGGSKNPSRSGPGAFGIPFHPGFALAFRRDVLDALGGLLEVGVLGAGDHHMCGALLGRAELTMPSGLHPNYRRKVMQWQQRADRVVHHDFGYVPGNLLHYFHGPKQLRQYVSRWSILVENDFDPEVDVVKNVHGVVELVTTKPGLRDGIRRYFLSRDEDCVRME